MDAITISFCTVSMNRLHHIKQTLPLNIKDNKSFKNVEFVLLDYNSTDGLEEWIMSNLSDYIKSGKLKYYRTIEPTFFRRSHSQNMSFKLASGNVLCNLDADNFTGKDFALFVASEFKKSRMQFLTPIELTGKLSNHNPPPDVFGRICFTKSAFLNIRGYTETIDSYGFQDYDFANRLELSGFQRTIISNPIYLKAIAHDNFERFVNERVYKLLYKIIFRYLSHGRTELIYLYKNNKCDCGILLNNKTLNSENPNAVFIQRSYQYTTVLEDGNWQCGKWDLIGGKLILNFNKGYYNAVHIVNKMSLYSEIKNRELVEQLIMFNTQLANRNIMNYNLNNKQVLTNNETFGNGNVFLNSDYSKNISI